MTQYNYLTPNPDDEDACHAALVAAPPAPVCDLCGEQMSKWTHGNASQGYETEYYCGSCERGSVSDGML